MGIIRNYGIFWDRHNVDWGGRGHGNAGTLQGALGRGSDPVDFRDQAGVYVLYEGESIPSQRVTYIGQAGKGNRNLFLRLREHTGDHLWNRWQRFSWFGIYRVGVLGKLVHVNYEKAVHTDVITVMSELEGALSVSLKPLLNKRGPNWKDVDEYFQIQPDEETVEDQLDEVRASLETLVEAQAKAKRKT